MKTFLSFLLFLNMVVVSHAEITTQEVTYKSGDTSLKGYLAYDASQKGKRPGVLVVHEWWGHNEHARERAVKVAELGYTALALDMYGDGQKADHPKKAGELMNAAFKDWEASQARFNAAKQLLQDHSTVDATRIASIGFCFGGAVSLRMAKGGADLAGVAGFHSALPVNPTPDKGTPPESPASIKAAVLVINGADDGFIKPETVGTFMQEMNAAKADLTYISLAGVKHSYTNKRADAFAEKFKIPNLKYDRKADERAWAELQRFLKRVFSR